MKKLFIAGTIVIIAILGLPFAFGIVAERQVERVVNNLSTPFMDVALVDYHRGWLSSEATVSLEPTKMLEQDVKLKVNEFDVTQFHPQMQLSIKHGPVILNESFSGSKKISFGQAFMTAKLFAQGHDVLAFLFSDAPVNHPFFTALININGNVHSHVDFPAEQFTSPDKTATFDWKGLTADVDFIPGRNNVKQAINFTGLTITDPNGSMVVDSFDALTNLTQHGNIWLGNGRVKLPKIEFNSNNSGNFKFTGGEVSFTNKLNDQDIDASMQFDLNTVMVDKQSYGPGKLQLRQVVNAKAWSNFMTAYENHLSEMGGQQNMSAVLMLLPMINEVLNKGFQFDLNQFEFATPQGELAANAHIAVAPNASMFPSTEHLKAAVNVSFPAGMTKNALSQFNRIGLSQMPPEQTLAATIDVEKLSQERAEQQIQEWLSQGLLIKEGNFYRFNAKIDKGNFEVNGKPINGDNLTVVN